MHRPTDELIDPSYGELVFNVQSWGYDADGNWNDNVRQIQDHACTRDELNISEVPDNPKFFEPSKDTAGIVNYYSNYLRCIDNRELSINGHSYSENVSRLEI